jgi:hypothetical protein
MVRRRKSGKAGDVAHLCRPCKKEFLWRFDLRKHQLETGHEDLQLISSGEEDETSSPSSPYPNAMAVECGTVQNIALSGIRRRYA